jgi:hypothetical protein
MPCLGACFADWLRVPAALLGQVIKAIREPKQAREGLLGVRPLGHPAVFISLGVQLGGGVLRQGHPIHSNPPPVSAARVVRRSLPASH